MSHSCGGCETTWTGANTAHCASCHLTFSGPTGFDEHRKGVLCATELFMEHRGYREVRPGILGLPAPTQGGGNG